MASSVRILRQHEGSRVLAGSRCFSEARQYNNVKSSLRKALRGQESVSTGEIRTLHPNKLAEAGQKVMDVSGQHTTTLMCRWSKVRVAFSTGPQQTPPDTTGVFYYCESEEQLRFRLCKTLDGFSSGKDLILPGLGVWNCSLRQLVTSYARYSPLLTLLRIEFASLNPEHRQRLLFTLNPRMLVERCQLIWDVSGHRSIDVMRRGEPFTTTSINYSSIDEEPFPASTKGVLYYQQSQVCPTRVGELRFRLCTGIHEFANGSDLRSPSGEVWHISANVLNSSIIYDDVRQGLIEEGLLEPGFYPSIPRSTASPSNVVLGDLSQPFVVDLSAKMFTIILTSKPSDSDLPGFMSLKFRHAFRHSAWPRNKVPLFNGRAVARLEQYPASDVLRRGLSENQPLFAMRILEFLTPLNRLEVDPLIPDPVPGQLLMRRHPSRTSDYLPWGYRCRNDTVHKAVSAWISTHL